MDKEQLDEIVMMSEEDYEMMSADMDQMARFIEFLLECIENLGGDPELVEEHFLENEEIKEETVH